MGAKVIRLITGDLLLAGNIKFTKDDTFSIGESGLEVKDIHIDGTANIDALADGVTLGGDAITKIKTGTYTGNGAVDQGITGVGFTPKLVWIWYDRFSAEADGLRYSKTDTFTGSYSYKESPSVLASDANRLISLDADGFSVDDDGIDENPNKNGVTYHYVAFG